MVKEPAGQNSRKESMEAHLRFRAFTGKRLHLGVCGSVAAFRTAELVRRWQEVGLGVGVTLTRAARNFITPLTFESLGAAPVYGDRFLSLIHS